MFLPGQLQSELQLPRIECSRGRLSAVPQRVHIRNVEAVDVVEGIHNAFERDPVTDWNSFGDPHIGEDVVRPGAGIPAEVAVERAIQKACRYQVSRG